MWGSKQASVMVLIVQCLEVNTEPQDPVLLSDQDHCASQWTVSLPDGTNIQHLLEMGLHIIIHVGVICQ